MAKIKAFTVIGTRPEAIKVAPVIKRMKENSNINLKVVVTGQHREMLDQVLNLFAIDVDFDLDIMQNKQSLTEITTAALKGLNPLMESQDPDIVLVQGDTTTAFAGSLAAFYSQIKVAHIEAGLRTGEKYSPFPEEMNRQLTGVLADLHFAPTSWARENLLQENKEKPSIFVSGNTVIDALQEVVTSDFCFKNKILKKLDYNKKVILLTCHRRENLGPPMKNIFQAVKEIVHKNPEVDVVFPVHLNPRIRKMSSKVFKNSERIHLLNPLQYVPFANLMARCYLILTDSGGIQEEAPSLGKPVLVLRDTTERPEGLKAGTVKLIGNSYDQVISEVNSLLTNKEEYEQMAQAVNPYGDGQAAKRIINFLLYWFNLRSDPGPEFICGD